MVRERGGPPVLGRRLGQQRHFQLRAANLRKVGPDLRRRAIELIVQPSDRPETSPVADTAELRRTDLFGTGERLGPVAGPVDLERRLDGHRARGGLKLSNARCARRLAWRDLVALNDQALHQFDVVGYIGARPQNARQVSIGRCTIWTMDSFPWWFVPAMTYCATIVGRTVSFGSVRLTKRYELRTQLTLKRTGAVTTLATDMRAEKEKRYLAIVQNLGWLYGENRDRSAQAPFLTSVGELWLLGDQDLVRDLSRFLMNLAGTPPKATEHERQFGKRDARHETRPGHPIRAATQ